MNPGAEAQGKALTQIIGHFNMKQTTVIIENSKYADTFLNGVRKTVHIRKQDIFNILALDSKIGTNALRQKLTDLSNKGWKVIVLHCSPDLMLRVVTIAMSTRLYNSGYAWFLSEMAFSRDPDIIAQLPEGLLAINSFWLGGVADVMVTALDYVMSATVCVLKEDPSSADHYVPYKVEKYSGNIDKRFTGKDENQEVDDYVTPVDGFRNSSEEFPYYFQRCLRHLVSFCYNSTGPANNETMPEESPEPTTSVGCIRRSNFDVSMGSSARNKGPAFYLLNTVDDGMGDRIWAKVGYISASGQRDLRTVLWPGHNIYGPSSNIVKTYRVVTRAAEPFVFINPLSSSKEECFVQVPCLQVPNSSQLLLTTIIDDFQSDMKHINHLYTIHCCKGLALEMLEKLAVDLNFRYVVYFVNDTNYGTVVNDNWTGMVGDVISGAADIIVGAFSVTSERMNVMDFTEPFFQNKLSVVTAEGDSSVSIWAFLSPFSGQVWMCIFLSSFVAGVATAFLEWHSPFGLNPRGRKRTKNYSLGSGLLMVMVLLTGHTINIKAPKSWPGKVIQNMWAGLAIFIMTSYTANLAAHLAGQSAVTSVKSVYDSDLLAKRVALIRSSAVESFVEKTTPKLSKRAKMNYVNSTISAINMLREHAVDIYLDDTVLLEYGLAKYDRDCKIRLAGPGKEFGSEGYAFGLSRHSWLQIPMSNQILWYVESGYIQELAKKYLSRPQCEHILAGTANPYGLEHTGGLFIIMVSAVLISVLTLVLEHLAYQYVVPWLREQPVDSFWKTESLAFISQRVFRVVRSEKLYSQKQAAQEMITIVRQRDFTRLIQKHELQKRRQATQKRVKTKAEVFQDITANIISYHRQLQSAPGTAENSYDEGDIEAAKDFHQGVEANSHTTPDVGVSSDAFSCINSVLVHDNFSPKRSRRMRTDSNSVDEDDDSDSNMCRGIFFKDTKQVERTRRKFVSKSWVLPEKDVEQPERQGSGFYTLCPSSDHSDPDAHNSFSWNASNYSTRELPLRTINDVKNKPFRRSSLRTLHINENGYSDRPLSTDCSTVPLNTSLSPVLPLGHDFPLSREDNYYYYSPSASSVHSVSDEKREFSPFSSNTSANNENFSGVEDSFEGASTISPDSSSSWASNGSHFQDSDSQNLDSLENISQTSTDPLIQNQQPAETSVNDWVLGYANQNRISFPSSIYEQPTRLSYEIEVLQPKKIARSQSAGSFSRPASQNNNPQMSDYTSRRKVNPNKADTANGMLEDNTRDGGTSFSEICTSNGVRPMENASTQPAMTTLKTTSDTCPLKSEPQMNQQQNNTRRSGSYDQTRRNYFTPSLKLKDNRVKSTLRRQAMSGHQNQLSANFIDEFTLDALSREDVLILWKKSEIELESKLQEVLARNRRLGLAIDYLTRQDRSDESAEV